MQVLLWREFHWEKLEAQIAEETQSQGPSTDALGSFSL